jgi:oligoendopeptidase F
MHSSSRSVRKETFHKYYAQYDGHKNTIAAALNGSVQRDVYYARARGYPSALSGALFHDNVPMSVYDNLIGSVHRNLPALYRYYDVRRRAMKLKDIHHYDTYVPILTDLDKRHTWDQAVKVVVDSLEPLGSQYTNELHRGLTTARWCDRYPNAGKHSGAFSYGTFDGAPYILMNYQPDVLDHVFTLTHEAGHSMHSWYSAKSQPFQYYGYTIFVAEVASTFNEQLLARHLMSKAKSDKERAYLINRQIDGIRGTIIRQTMFAEFEKVIHALVEAGEPLTVDTLRKEYRKLLELYFGPDFVIDPELELECLRIPHFYRAC